MHPLHGYSHNIGGSQIGNENGKPLPALTARGFALAPHMTAEAGSGLPFSFPT